MNAAVLACAVLLIASFAFIFWPQRRVTRDREKTRLDYLRERREVIFDNLRDLNFEFRAGKYPQDDFERQRTLLEAEAADVLREMDTLAA